MRTLTTGEQDIVLGARFRIGLKIDVETSSGGFNDLTSFRSGDWVVGAEWSEDVDQPVGEASVLLRRDLSTALSLSPLRTDSTANQNSTGGYTPAIDVGREVKIHTAMVAASCEPGSTDFKLMFHGEIDEWDARQDPLEIRARDLGALLQDRWVESTGASYGSSSGTALETVIQNILSSQLSTDAPTLLTPASPGFAITVFKPDPQPVMEAIQRLGDHIGWDVRYRWANTSSAFFLTLYGPARTSTTPDSTISPDRYAFVRKMALNRQDIRNAVTVEYPTSSGRQSVSVSATSSIDLYGRRWLHIVEGGESPINTSSEANTFAQAVLDDLKDPKAEKSVELHYLWPVQLGDLLRLSANNVQYTADQDLAVTGYRHIVQLDEQRTVLSMRGKPLSKSKGWLAYQAQGPVASAVPEWRFTPPAVQHDVTRTDSTGVTTITIADPSRAVKKVEFNERVGDGAAGGWSTSWSSFTGVEGQSSAITAVRNSTVQEGKDTELRIRVTYLNEKGDEEKDERTAHFANMDEVTKTVIFPFSMFAPNNDATKFLLQNASSAIGILNNTTSTATQECEVSFQLPPGVTLTQIEARTFEESSNSVADVILNRYNTTEAVALLATLVHGTSGSRTMSAAISQLVSTDQFFDMQCFLAGTGGITNARFSWARLTYTMPQYNKGL